ncbi:MAG TPA: helix-turn-helix domain-containing protein [Thermoanaerobaculia bacterium]
MAKTAEVLRIAGLLEALIAFKKMPIRQLERELGVSNGTLARIFSGKIELKYRHILDILELLQVTPLSFFELAYQGSDDEDTQEVVAKLGKISMPKPMPPPEVNPDLIQAMVLEALRKFEVLPPEPDDAEASGDEARDEPDSEERD